MRTGRLLGAIGFFWAISLGLDGQAAGVNVRGKLAGTEKLIPDVYSEAAKTDSKRWTWREPSPAVPAAFRALSAPISREVCVVATNNGTNPAAPQPLLVRVAGGRTQPVTLVVTPGSQLQFRNDDPFAHRLVQVGEKGWNGAMDARGTIREWKAPQATTTIEFRDELFPSVRTFVRVDAQVVSSVYPAHDHSFGLSLPSGEYVIKVFFSGKQVGKPVSLAVKDRGNSDLKDPLNVGTDTP